MVKSIIKRIIIVVGIVLCLSYISSLIGFIPFNVYASEDIPFRFGIYNTSGSPTIVSEKDGVSSNIFVDDTQNPLSTFNYYLFGVDTSTCENDFCDLTSDPVRRYYSLNNLYNRITYNYPYQGTTSVTYFGSFNFTFYRQFQLKDSSHYKIYYAINKSSNDIRFNESGLVDLNGLNATIGTGTSEYNLLPYVDNLEVVYHIFHDKINSQSNWAYVSLDFDTPSSFTSNFNGDVYLSSVLYSINAPDAGYSNIAYPFNSLFYFPSQKGNSVNTQNFLFVIENGDVYYTGVDCNEESNSCHSGSAYSGNMDYTNYEDVEVINSIPVCVDTDIICHIKRVFSMIEKLFTRFGNFFRDLFDDSITWDLDTNSDMTPISNLLTMPITLINAFITGFDSTCSPYTLGTLYNYTFTLPCIDLTDYLGSTLWIIIDGLCSLFMLFNIARLIITFFDKSTSLDDMFGLMYHVHDYNVRESDDIANGVVR